MFIAGDAPDVATRFVHRLKTHFEPLRHHPELGPKRDAIAPGLRAHFFQNYVIYYRITETTVVIVRILHGARDTARLFGEDSG